MARRGVRVSVVRLPQVHDRVKQGLVTYVIDVAREKGVSAFVGDGLYRWPAVHVLDTARLYRLALEKGDAGARYNAVGEEGVPFREIAEAVGRGLKVKVIAKSPAEASDHFGWLGFFMGIDCPGLKRANAGAAGMASDGPGLISDLDHAQYWMIHDWGESAGVEKNRGSLGFARDYTRKQASEENLRAKCRPQHFAISLGAGVTPAAEA